MAKGISLIISGPSGVGKDTLADLLRRNFPVIRESVSCTTRPPRPGEYDGVDYHFMTREAFDRLREEGGLAECAMVHGQWYGTPLAPLKKAVLEGANIIFVLDVTGAMNLKKSFDEHGIPCLTVFLMPPSLEETERRMRARGGDSEETVRLRVKNAAEEMKAADKFDEVILNDDLNVAYGRLEEVFLARHRAAQKQ